MNGRRLQRLSREAHLRRPLVTPWLCCALTLSPIMGWSQPSQGASTQSTKMETPPASAPPPAAASEISADAVNQARPPRPLTPGKMPIVLGWITFGVGALATLGGLEFMLLNDLECDGIASADGSPGGSNDCGPSANTVLFTTTAGTLTLLGLGVAIYGHARRANARYDQREWDSRFGDQPFAWGIGDRLWASITPTFVQRRGLSASLHF